MIVDFGHEDNLGGLVWDPPNRLMETMQLTDEQAADEFGDVATQITRLFAGLAQIENPDRRLTRVREIVTHLKTLNISAGF